MIAGRLRRPPLHAENNDELRAALLRTIDRAREDVPHFPFEIVVPGKRMFEYARGKRRDREPVLPHSGDDILPLGEVHVRDSAAREAADFVPRDAPGQPVTDRGPKVRRDLVAGDSQGEGLHRRGDHAAASTNPIAWEITAASFFRRATIRAIASSFLFRSDCIPVISAATTFAL